MKKAIRIIIFMVLVTILFGCKNNSYKKDLMLHLSFDENEGTKVFDKTNNLDAATIQYVFTNPMFMDNQKEPEWRKNGISNGSLLFDGYSNFIRYSYDDIVLGGMELTISVWVAPRYFEAAQSKSTAIVSQFNTNANEGVFLGYYDHGSLHFQVGVGDRNFIIKNEEKRLLRYEWNHVVAVFSGTTGEMFLYLNGEKISELSFFDGVEITKAYAIPLYIAKNSEGGSNATANLNMFSGLMDELKIYKKAVKESFIEEEYQKVDIPKIEFEDIWLQNILTEDYYKTQYHGGPYQHWMNEPHAPIYYNGVYHLFFQFNMFGPYFANISWGHLVSDDMVNWRPIKEVIVPTKNTVAEHGVWSGGATYDRNGVPVLLFTAGHYNNGLLSSQNVGIARPKDTNDPYLTEWIVDDELAIIQVHGQGVAGEFRDAHVIIEDNVWYLVLASQSTITNGGTALLYTTRDDSFKNWKYEGQLYEIPNQRGDLGRVWELPVLLPIWNETKTIKKYILLISPAPADRADNDIYYFLGDFDKENGRFIPDEEFIDNPKLLDYGNNVFTGPSGFVDPISGKSFVFSIMQDQRKPGDVYQAGWANCVGLAREVYLLENGLDVGIRPIKSLAEYETNIYKNSNISLDVLNQKISNIKGDMLHIQVVFENINATQFGIKVRKHPDLNEETIIYYDATTNEVGIRTGLSGSLNNYQNVTGNFKGSLALVDGKLKLDIYLDRSLVEVFANETKAISSRIYPDNESLHIQLFSENGEILIKFIEIGEMRSIYE
jgi:sucrose-6-phosphate hydrolase SacC (GH32 family)